MSCCSSSKDTSSESLSSKRRLCPANGKEYLQVPFSTILQHIKKPWNQENTLQSEQAYYFCSDPDCDVVYFGEDDTLINKSDLRTLVTIKEPSNADALACYCFDITLKEVKNDPKLKQYVIDKTKNNLCACESQNPSGRCCLKDFPTLE